MALHEHDALTAQPADSAGWLAVAAALIAPAPVAIVITAGAEHIVRASNDAFAHLVHRDLQTLPDHLLGDVLSTAQWEGSVALLDGVMRTGDPVVAATQPHAHPVRGTVYWTYTVWPIFSPHQRPAGLIIHVRDTTAQEQARCHAEQAVHELRLVNEQLLLAGLREQALATAATHEALHDSLTALPNRSLLLERVTHALQVTRRDHHPFALLLLDLDRFKAVNDTLGHMAGDAFLQHIAQQLVACVRESDTVARLGGDEFAILLTDVVHISEVLHIADRIHQHLARPVHIQGRDLLTSTSIGIVLHTPAYTQAEELVRDADTALYRAKALGKAQYVVFDPTMHAQAVALAALEADLRHALARDEFELYYQPIVALQTGTVLGVEALLRWHHPERGCLTPAVFLATAEDTGVILPLGEWVLRTACQQLQHWHAAGLSPMYVAVNLSARHLTQRDLAPTVAHILHDTGVPSHALQIELTESSVMEDVATAIATLHALTALGVQVAVDDFGTGYSSLSYLKRLPITTVKVDRTFVDGITTDPNDAAITAATIAMAHRLGLHVIAEGVETTAQLRHLQREQCDAVQGYLVSPPRPAAALTAQLTDGQWLPPRIMQRGG